MWTRTITSGTTEYATRADVLRELLRRLLEKRVESSWAHFEVIAEGGWFTNLLSGKGPWVEVAYSNPITLEINLGVPKKLRSAIPSVPDKWEQKKDVWHSPIADLGETIAWLDLCLMRVCARPDCRIAGWLEGL